jgi:hypothetical protein
MELDYTYINKGKRKHRKTSTRTGRKKEKGQTPQQLEKKCKKGTRANRLELDG